LNDINTQVINTNFFEVKKNQKVDINIQKTNTFPQHIEIQNNISCLQQYNNFMKHISFQFNCCCVCNEKTFMKELTICSILDLNTKLRNMKNLLKMNPKHHLLNYNKIILKELLLDTIHVHLELDGLLLAKKGISNTELKHFMSTTCYIFIQINKMPKLTLANGLWIGIAPKMLPNLIMVEETLITRYHC
jgi:hypothetical protein